MKQPINPAAYELAAQQAQQAGNIAGVPAGQLPDLSMQQEQAKAMADGQIPPNPYGNYAGMPHIEGGEMVSDTVSYLLSLHVPLPYRDEFHKWLLLVNKVAATGYIERDDLWCFILLFRIVRGWYRLGDYKSAREYSAEFLFILNLTKSVKGAFLQWMNTVRQEKITSFPELQTKQKKGFLGRIFGGK